LPNILIAAAYMVLITLEGPRFACKGLSHTHSTPTIPKSLIIGVDALVLSFDNLTVTSWYRCEEHNRAVGGAEGSLHITGRAVDIDTGDNCVYDVARQARGLFSYVKIYDWGIHADVR
jgi:hypothetical protein